MRPVSQRRLAAVGLLAGAVLVAGWLILSAGGDDERWGVLGMAFDPPEVAAACREVAQGEIGYALTSDAPDPEMMNVYATVGSRERANRVADCFRKHGADSVEVSEAGPVGSFRPN